MKYKLRYDSDKLMIINCSTLVSMATLPEVGLNELKDITSVKRFDEIKTIFTRVDGITYQFSTAILNPGVLASLRCFGAQSTQYMSIDDKSIYHSVEELKSVLDSLRAGAVLADVKLCDYELNSGEVLELQYEIGEEYSGKICAGYSISSRSHFRDVTPIFVNKKKWEEFKAFIEVSDYKTTTLINLLK